MKNKTLSEFEWQIMRIVWNKSEISVRETHAIIQKKQERAYTTVQTYMERLVKKDFLKKQKTGMINLYSALVKEEDIQKNETSSFIKKAFNGSFSKMAAFLFDMDNLTEKDLEKIKSLLEEKENE